MLKRTGQKNQDIFNLDFLYFFIILSNTYGLIIFLIENNQRTVRDYELCALSIALDIDIHDLVMPFINKLSSQNI